MTEISSAVSSLSTETKELSILNVKFMREIKKFVKELNQRWYLKKES